MDAIGIRGVRLPTLRNAMAGSRRPRDEEVYR
jgi:hypothetical protein